tara:strand:- start:3723 stop:5024 length:1302 start_codon:yes stop_codon:yes gene_type:complete
MKFTVFLAFFVLLGTSLVFGISSNDAINLVANSNHFLYDAETYTPPNVTMEANDNEYWVIPLTAGNTVITYFAVDVESGELSVSRAVNRDLFGVAENLRELQLLKSSISANPGVDWVFTQKYQTIFNEMALEFNDEIFQLNTVEITLNSEGFSANLTSLKNELQGMASDASEISEKISTASQKENDFVTKPSEESFTEMNGAYDSVFDSISSLNDASLSYKSNIDKLKNDISLADFDAQTKSQLFAILDLPQGSQALRNYNLDASQINESFDSALFTSSLRRDSLLDELDNRIAKDEVYNLIYGNNEKISEGTEFSSLFELQSYILSPDNKSLWENQSKVRELEQNYSRATKFESERNFEDAKEYSLTAIDSAVSVYKKGFKEFTPDPGISQDLLFSIAGFLIAVLIILYLINNRRKIKDMISEKPEELDIYD